MRIDNIFLFLTLLTIFTALSWISSCTHKVNIDDLPEICFERDVLPIFLNSCAIAGCHDGTGEDDLILDSYENIFEEVKPGDPLDSKIYKVLITTSGEDKMPPDQPLSLENRTLIRFWIEQGARFTICPGN